MTKLIFRIHALKRMFTRGINEQDIRHILELGEVIENYPEDKPFPSRLILGWRGSRPIHLVTAEKRETRETIVITVYEPDLNKWEPGFKKRRRS